MRLILEGPDNAGKTTLSNFVMSHTILPRGRLPMYRHPGGPPSSLGHEMACIRQQMMWLKEEYIIVDRVTPISQQVYDPDPNKDVGRRIAVLDMLETGCVLVYVRPPVDHLLRTSAFTWREGESEEFKQKIIRGQHEYVERYDRLMATIPHVPYDFSEVESPVRFWLISAMQGDETALGSLRAARIGGIKP